MNLTLFDAPSSRMQEIAIFCVCKYNTFFVLGSRYPFCSTLVGIHAEQATLSQRASSQRGKNDKGGEERDRRTAGRTDGGAKIFSLYKCDICAERAARRWSVHQKSA